MLDLPARLVEALEDRYTLQRELGRGGMATVYLAEDLRHGRRVAIKVLKPELAAVLGPERFLREIKLTAQLNHPHILPLLDSGEAGGLLYYVMPYLVGESLRDRLKLEKQLPIDDALRVTREVADALDYAHQNKVVHRDIKPDNILFQAGHAVVADFGIARAISAAGGEKLTTLGTAVGTPEYMSPEQAGGEDDIDGRSDQYALACVLYEMLSGHPPFTGGTAQAVLARHATDPVPSLRTVRRTVSGTLEQTIGKAMAKVPADRYATVALFSEALRRSDPGESAAAPARLRRWQLGMLAGVGVTVAAALWLVSTRDAPGLDPNRITVFPLVVSQEVGSASLGEDVATMIGSALDGVGPLRWIDGWPRLAPAARQDIRALTDEQATAIARTQRSGYYVTGRISLRGDSAEVSLVLQDVRGRADPVRAAAGAPIGEVWRGSRAVNLLLQALIGVVLPGGTTEWDDRSPAAIASYLLGEAAFRRLQLEEALRHYRGAVNADSAFALAAIRGAQAASWMHRNAEAAALTETALRHPLPPRYTAFAYGLKAYLEGRADSAIAALHAALALDQDMAVGWMQLAEAWVHLMPKTGMPEDSALAALEQAARLDSTSANPLFHLIEILLRRGEVGRAEPMVQRFLATQPDRDAANNIEIMFACAGDGPERVPWGELASERPLALLVASLKWSGSSARPECAAAGFRALLQADTIAADLDAQSRRYFAMLALQNLRLAQGRDAEALAEVDAHVARWQEGSSVYLQSAPYSDLFVERAREVARADQQRYGPTYRRLEFSNRLWKLGLFHATRGDVAVAAAIAADLAERGARKPSSYDSLLAASLESHVALARGDTAGALQLLEALVPARATGDQVKWDEGQPLGAERLQLARLLAARGENHRAIAIADVLDSSWPMIHTLYLRPSLLLRAEAAAASGDRPQEARFRARLALLEEYRGIP